MYTVSLPLTLQHPCVFGSYSRFPHLFFVVEDGIVVVDSSELEDGTVLDGGLVLSDPVDSKLDEDTSVEDSLPPDPPQVVPVGVVTCVLLQSDSAY